MFRLQQWIRHVGIQDLPGETVTKWFNKRLLTNLCTIQEAEDILTMIEISIRDGIMGSGEIIESEQEGRIPISYVVEQIEEWLTK